MGRGSARNRGSCEIASILTSLPSDNGQILIQNTNYLQLLQKRQSESCHLPFTICSPQKKATQPAMLTSTFPPCSAWAPRTEAHCSLERNQPGGGPEASGQERGCMEGPEEGVLRGDFIQTGVMSRGEWWAYPPCGPCLLHIHHWRICFKTRLTLRWAQ